GMETRERLLAVAGADLSDVDEVLPAVGAHQEGSEVRSRSGRRRVAADDELLLLVHLDLQPLRAAPLDVGRGRVLGHDAFEAAPDRLPVRGETVGRETPRGKQAVRAPDRLL